MYSPSTMYQDPPYIYRWLVNSPSTRCRIEYHGVRIRSSTFLQQVKELLLYYVKLRIISVYSSGSFTSSWSHHLTIWIVPSICPTSAQSSYMERQATFSAMVVCRLLMYSLMGWIPAASTAATTRGYSHSPLSHVSSPSLPSSRPPGDENPPGPWAFPLSPPSSHCRTRALIAPPHYISFPVPTPLLPSLISPSLSSPATAAHSTGFDKLKTNHYCYRRLSIRDERRPLTVAGPLYLSGTRPNLPHIYIYSI